jgi:hypothetical protein
MRTFDGGLIRPSTTKLTNPNLMFSDNFPFKRDTITQQNELLQYQKPPNDTAEQQYFGEIRDEKSNPLLFAQHQSFFETKSHHPPNQF